MGASKNIDVLNSAVFGCLRRSAEVLRASSDRIWGIVDRFALKIFFILLISISFVVVMLDYVLKHLNLIHNGAISLHGDVKIVRKNGGIEVISNDKRSLRYNECDSFRVTMSPGMVTLHFLPKKACGYRFMNEFRSVKSEIFANLGL
jgi:hypothetical protein